MGDFRSVQSVHVVQFMLGQIPKNIQGIWCFSKLSTSINKQQCIHLGEYFYFHLVDFRDCSQYISPVMVSLAKCVQRMLCNPMLNVNVKSMLMSMSM